MVARAFAYSRHFSSPIASSRSKHYTVLAPHPSWTAAARCASRPLRIWGRIAAHAARKVRSSVRLGRPIAIPWALARFIPAVTRSRISSSSNSAREARRFKSKRPNVWCRSLLGPRGIRCPMAPRRLMSGTCVGRTDTRSSLNTSTASNRRFAALQQPAPGDPAPEVVGAGRVRVFPHPPPASPHAEPPPGGAGAAGFRAPDPCPAWRRGRKA